MPDHAVKPFAPAPGEGFSVENPSGVFSRSRRWRTRAADRSVQWPRRSSTRLRDRSSSSRAARRTRGRTSATRRLASSPRSCRRRSGLSSSSSATRGYPPVSAGPMHSHAWRDRPRRSRCSDPRWRTPPQPEPPRITSPGAPPGEASAIGRHARTTERRPRGLGHRGCGGTKPELISASLRSCWLTGRCWSLLSDRFSIWRIRSRVTLNVRPTSSRVRGCSPPSP